MGLTDNIVVKDFMFCAEHGDEYCHKCCCDHRMGNNVRIEDELGDMSEFFEFEVEERQPINAYAHGAVVAVQTEESYECESHRKVDCEKCFDWVAIIKKEAETIEEEGRWPTARRSWTVGAVDVGVEA
ncbi:hypothetical protein BDQ12DRAFT_687074 [Crucibulum laeve]|uniref:Uncharacterized protein n=1 Tax=Crucibulum laeve TaxID=68775 RepID=A0A5C3LTI9_9AGAR|nr:hypothetical protein BDQ12DRAFT_687074 [Crucibulum laeve]